MGLGDEPFPYVVVLGEPLRQLFDSDGTAELGVARFVDDAKRTSPELTCNFVGGQCLLNQLSCAFIHRYHFLTEPGRFTPVIITNFGEHGWCTRISVLQLGCSLCRVPLTSGLSNGGDSARLRG